MRGGLLACLLGISLLGLAAEVPCSVLTRREDVTLSGGHSKECFSKATLSFETCRQLLVLSQCWALSYQQKRCSLHDQKRGSFKLRSLGGGNSGAIVYIKEVEVESVECANREFKSALRKFQECEASPHGGLRGFQGTEAESSPLPLLGIIISVTSHWAHTHKAAIASITSNFQCYASAHNYSFILNILPDMPVEQFFHDRHHSILTHFLHKFQYILHLDADSLVLNITRPLDNFLKRSSPHVQLHMNENGEVTAATYLIKNSNYGRCFLEYWSNFSPPRPSNFFLKESRNDYTTNVLHDSSFDERLYDVPNYDNGDLVAAVLNLLDPEFYLTCMRVVTSLPPRITHSFKNEYHQTIVECWKIFQSSMNDKTKGNLMKIYLPKEGYWRTHSRRNRFSSEPTHWWNTMKASCFPSSDIIGHGWKGMMRKMWPMVSDKNGNFDIQHVNSTRLCRSALVGGSRGGNAKCRWLSPDDEYRIVSRYCNWKSPACIQESDRDCGVSSTSLPEQMVRTPQLSQNFSAVIDKKTSCNMCLVNPTAQCFRKISEGVSTIPYNSRTNSIYDILRKSDFRPNNEQWWINQMCSACPP